MKRWNLQIGREHESERSGPFRRAGREFVFLEQARNVRRALDHDPDITQLRDLTIPTESNPWTSAKWIDRPVDKHKYVDDGILDTKLDMENVITKHENGQPVCDKHAVACQNVFRRVIRNTELIGMNVNADKTKQVCVSDLTSFHATTHIYSSAGRGSRRRRR